MERVFDSVDANGVAGTVKLRVGLPYFIAESTSEMKWRCPYQILGIGSDTVKEAPGIDAIDALITSLRLAEIRLKSDSHSYAVKITWLNEEYLGFPTIHSSPTEDEDNSVIKSEDNPLKKAFDEFFRDFENNTKR